MPRPAVSRIPIDGLWRCLCPSIDGLALQHAKANGLRIRSRGFTTRPRHEQVGRQNRRHDPTSAELPRSEAVASGDVPETHDTNISTSSVSLAQDSQPHHEAVPTPKVKALRPTPGFSSRSGIPDRRPASEFLAEEAAKKEARVVKPAGSFAKIKPGNIQTREEWKEMRERAKKVKAEGDGNRKEIPKPLGAFRTSQQRTDLDKSGTEIGNNRWGVAGRTHFDRRLLERKTEHGIHEGVDNSGKEQGRGDVDLNDPGNRLDDSRYTAPGKKQGSIQSTVLRGQHRNVSSFARGTSVRSPDWKVIPPRRPPKISPTPGSEDHETSMSSASHTANGDASFKIDRIPSIKGSSSTLGPTARNHPLPEVAERFTISWSDVTEPPERREWDEIPLTQLYDRLDSEARSKSGHAAVCDLVTYLIYHRGDKPSLIHYTALIKANASAENGSVDAVRDLLQEMKSLGISASSEFYHAVLQVLAIHPHYLLREDILQEMKMKWLGLSPDGWHSYIVGLLRDRQYEVAMDKLEQMHTDGIAVQPWLYDIFTYQLGEAGELDECFKLIRLRHNYNKRAVEPSVWYYLLDIFSKNGHYAGTKYIWKHRVLSQSLNPSDGICTSTLYLAARHADPKLATSATKILSSRAGVLAAHHYEALIAAYANLGDFKAAIHILVVMRKLNMTLDARMTRPLYSKLCEPKQSPHLAWQDIKTLHAEGVIIPVVAANVILEACCEVDSIDTAMTLYRELHDVVTTGPDTETFNTLLQAARSSSNTKDLCMFLASEMAALNVQPDKLTYDRLILACLPEKDYEDAFRYLQEMVQVGDTEGEEWWLRQGTARNLVKRCVLAGDERARRVLSGMEERGMDVWGLGKFVKEMWGRGTGDLEGGGG